MALGKSIKCGEFSRSQLMRGLRGQRQEFGFDSIEWKITEGERHVLIMRIIYEMIVSGA